MAIQICSERPYKGVARLARQEPFVPPEIAGKADAGPFISQKRRGSCAASEATSVLVQQPLFRIGNGRCVRRFPSACRDAAPKGISVSEVSDA